MEPEAPQPKPEPFNFIRIPLKQTVSYLLSNIACSEDHVACLRNCDSPPKFQIFQLKNKNAKNAEYTVDQEAESTVISFSYENLKGAWKLVVLLRECVKIYSENGQNLLGHIDLNIPNNKKKEIEKNGIVHYFAACAKVAFNNKELLAVCNTLNEILFIEEGNNGNYVSWVCSHGVLGANPCQIIYSQSENLLILANIEGKLTVNSIKDEKKLNFIKEVDANTKKTPITGLNIMQGKTRHYLVSGDFLGKIKLWDLKNMDILLEINSHARIITSLDVRNEPCEILTGSEDSFLNFWKIEEDEKGDVKVSLKVSFRIADQIIVGAKYLKNGGEAVVSIYDSNEITLLKYEKN